MKIPLYLSTLETRADGNDCDWASFECNETIHVDGEDNDDNDNDELVTMTVMTSVSWTSSMSTSTSFDLDWQHAQHQQGDAITRTFSAYEMQDASPSQEQADHHNSSSSVHMMNDNSELGDDNARYSEWLPNVDYSTPLFGKIWANK